MKPEESLQPTLQAFFELMIVGGLSLVTLFWIIPSQTEPSDNFGLSPSMVPTVCVVSIAVLAILQFFSSFLKTEETDKRQQGLGIPSAIVASTIIGTILIDTVGLVTGGAVVAGLIAIVIGERRIPNLVTIMVSAVFLLLFVEWSGL